MSVEWQNRVSSGGLPYVTVECSKCRGKAVLEKVFEGTRFRHCGTVDCIPLAIFQAYETAMANFRAGKPAAGQYAVRYI